MTNKRSGLTTKEACQELGVSRTLLAYVMRGMGEKITQVIVNHHAQNLYSPEQIQRLKERLRPPSSGALK